MAYVNMTVDGQTKRTDVVNLVASNGDSKTAILSAVLEAADVPQGGGVETGVSVGNGTNTMDLATDKSHILCIPNGAISSVLTGTRAIVFFFIDKDKDVVYGAGSNAAGTAAGTPGNWQYTASNAIARVEDGKAVSKVDNGIFTDGKEYAWFAW